MKPVADCLNQPHCNFWNRMTTLLLEETNFLECRGISYSNQILRY